MPRPHGFNDVRELRTAGAQHLVCMMQSDEMQECGLNDLSKWCADTGLRLLHLPVKDRGLPTDPASVLAAAHQLAATLQAGESVVVHCRGGIGRASLMAAVVLRVLGYSADDAFDMIRHARGCPVPDTDDQRRWVRDLELAAAPQQTDAARDAFNSLFDEPDRDAD